MESQVEGFQPDLLFIPAVVSVSAAKSYSSGRDWIVACDARGMLLSGVVATPALKDANESLSLGEMVSRAAAEGNAVSPGGEELAMGGTPEEGARRLVRIALERRAHVVSLKDGWEADSPLDPYSPMWPPEPPQYPAPPSKPPPLPSQSDRD